MVNSEGMDGISHSTMFKVDFIIILLINVMICLFGYVCVYVC